MRLLFTVLALAAIAGCADSAPPAAPVHVASAAPAAAPASAGQQICTREATVGSNRPHTICYEQGGPKDPNNPDVQRAVDGLSRQSGQMQGTMSRANGGGH